MTCQFCGSSSQLIFIGSKSVSVYMHVAGVSAPAHNKVDRAVYCNLEIYSQESLLIQVLRLIDKAHQCCSQ